MSVTDRDHEIIRLAFAMEIPPAEQKKAAAPPDPVKPEPLVAGTPVRPTGTIEKEAVADGLSSVVDVEVERIGSTDAAKAAIEAFAKNAGVLAGIGRMLPLLPRLGAKVTGVAGRGMRELSKIPALAKLLPGLQSTGAGLAAKSRLAPLISKISPDVLRQMTGVGLGTAGAGAVGTAATLKALLGKGSPEESTKRDTDKPEKEAADAQAAKKKETESETPSGVVRLESASDTPPKRAPEKKPEPKSENAAAKQALVGPQQRPEDVFGGVSQLLSQLFGKNISLPGPVVMRAGGTTPVLPTAGGARKSAAVDPMALLEAARSLRERGREREERLRALPVVGGAAAGGAGGYGLLKVMQAARALAGKYPAFGQVMRRLAPYAGAGLGAAGAGLGGYMSLRKQLRKPTIEVGPEALEALARLSPASSADASKYAAHVSTPSVEMGLPVRGFSQSSTKRDAIFREVARWSLGEQNAKDTDTAA